MTAVPHAQQAAFPACILPGCHGITETDGEPCADCVRAFGPMLQHNPDGIPLAPAIVVERDAGTLAAYHQQRNAAQAERKPMQLCWLCEERRTCTNTVDGWECDSCQRVTPWLT